MYPVHISAVEKSIKIPSKKETNKLTPKLPSEQYLGYILSATKTSTYFQILVNPILHLAGSGYIHLKTKPRTGCQLAWINRQKHHGAAFYEMTDLVKISYPAL